VDKQEAIKKLEQQRQALLSLQGCEAVGDAFFKKWYRNTELAIEFVIGKKSRHLQDFHDVIWSAGLGFVRAARQKSYAGSFHCSRSKRVVERNSCTVSRTAQTETYHSP
jgi:hypothetical protein